MFFYNNYSCQVLLYISKVTYSFCLVMQCECMSNDSNAFLFFTCFAQLKNCSL